GFHLICDVEPQSLEAAPQSPEQAPPSPDYVPSPEYPEYLARTNDEIPIKDQPLPADASPTALSPGYVVDSDPLEEDLEEDPEEDLANYPTDEGEEEEEEDSSKDDDDDEEEASKDEEEHLVSANSTLPAIDYVPSAEETEPFETDESAATPAPSRSPQTIVPFSMTRVISPRLICRLRRGYVSLLPLLASEGRVITTVEEVNERVTDLAATQMQDAHELYVRHEDAQDDRALLRAQIFLLTRERRYFLFRSLSYEREAVYARQAWSRSKVRITALEALIRAHEARITALEAQIMTLQTHHGQIEW
ncbi:hypothetical protein Tco_0442524, partial [Tanacetum coccineum]